MTADDAVEKSETAYHEAGHAGVATLRGYPPTRIRLYVEEPEPSDLLDWKGDTTGLITEYADRVRIALGGPLAEAKYLSGGRMLANRDDEAQVQSLLPWNDERVKRKLALPLSVPLEGVDDQPVTVTGDDLDLLCNRLGHIEPEAVAAALPDVRANLNDPGVWKAITEIAAALLAKVPTQGPKGVRREVVLEGEELQSLLRQVTSA